MSTYTNRATRTLRYSLNRLDRAYADPENPEPDDTSLKRASGWRDAVLDLVDRTRGFMANWSEEDALYAHRYPSAWSYWTACHHAQGADVPFGVMVVEGALDLVTPKSLANRQRRPVGPPQLRLVKG